MDRCRNICAEIFQDSTAYLLKEKTRKWWWEGENKDPTAYFTWRKVSWILNGHLYNIFLKLYGLHCALRSEKKQGNNSLHNVGACIYIGIQYRLLFLRSTLWSYSHDQSFGENIWQHLWQWRPHCPQRNSYTNIEIIRTLSRKNKNEKVCSRRKLSGFHEGKWDGIQNDLQYFGY